MIKIKFIFIIAMLGFLFSVIAYTQVQGIQSINGTNGTNGTNGLNGTNGTNGTNGLNGTNGTNGTNGLNGTNGTNGTNGLNGTNIKNNLSAIFQYLSFEKDIEGFSVGKADNSKAHNGSYSYSFQNLFPSKTFAWPSYPFNISMYWYYTSVRTTANPLRLMATISTNKMIYFDLSGIVNGDYDYATGGALVSFSPAVHGTINTWNKIDFILHNSTNYDIKINGTTRATNIAYEAQTSNIGYKFYEYSNTLSWWVDDITIQPIAPPSNLSSGFELNDYNGGTWCIKISANGVLIPVNEACI